MSTEEKYMDRCIQLALNGRYGAAPNPMVGAVIVRKGEIIGEGYHRQCGGPHAEVNAIRSVKDPSLLKESTIYVSLEPCSHYGKTPPCADLIIEKGIPRVVVGCQDPFAKVAGRGIQKLKNAGIEVITGIREKECLALNKRFITFQLHHRPYITLKWAESSDGFIDTIRDPKVQPAYRFSTPYTQMYVHRLRAINQAIMVGRRTALADNPSLTNRHWPGPQPLRITIDRHASLPTELHLFDGSCPTKVYQDLHVTTTRPPVNDLNIVPIDFSADILPQIMNDLYQTNIQSLLVEGGSQLHTSFIKDGLWDEIFIEISPVYLHIGVPAPQKPNKNIDTFTIDGHKFIHISKSNITYSALKMPPTQ